MQPAAALRCLLRRPGAARAALPPLYRASSATSNAAPEAPAKEASAADEKKQRPEGHRAGVDDEDTKHPSNPRDDVLPFAPSPRLESRDVAPPQWPPVHQQKRRLSRADPAAIANVACVGPDGTPLGEGKKEEEDYREYFSHRKPSPLSELAFVDTRKPITQATASVAVGDDTGMGVMVQVSADETLAWAEAIFRMRKAMGDPELPHSRVLRRMLGEAVDEPPVDASLY